MTENIRKHAGEFHKRSERNKSLSELLASIACEWNTALRLSRSVRRSINQLGALDDKDPQYESLVAELEKIQAVIDHILFAGDGE